MTESPYLDIKSLLKKGRYFAAFNLAEKALHDEPDNIKVNQIYGLSLAKLGLLEKAKLFLWDLNQSNRNDSETAGILGGVLKGIYKKTNSQKDAALSRDIYMENYRNNKSFYTGINAASMSMVMGDTLTATKIASEITDNIDPVSRDFWELVTLGEANLLLRNTNAAINKYQEARNIIEKDYGVFNSVFAQLVLLEGYIDIPDEIKVLFKPATVVVFTGHMIDHPDNSRIRFPENISDIISGEIAQTLIGLEASIGYSSLACGADILFVEEMIKRNAEVNLFLPYSMSDFLMSSVAFAGPQWLERFNRILETQSVNYITEEGYFGNDDLHALLGSVIFGKSILRAASFNTEPVLLTVLSPSKTKNQALTGGTEYLVDKWPFKKNIYSIDPGQFFEKTIPSSVLKNIPQTTESSEVESRKIRHILFADVVGYSKLSEDKTPFFVENLLQDISKNISSLSHEPEILNTWGDSIFAVYSNIRQIMEFAMALQKTLTNASWQNISGNNTISMRIALHTGPVFLLNDPVTNRKNAFGNHINRAARMEPVTTPGSIYASDQFASVLNIECYNEYDFEYVGIIDLPKEFGKQEMYRINIQSE